MMLSGSHYTSVGRHKYDDQPLQHDSVSESLFLVSVFLRTNTDDHCEWTLRAGRKRATPDGTANDQPCSAEQDTAKLSQRTRNLGEGRNRWLLMK